MQPIKTKKIYEEITDHIINRVKQGELVSGDRLESVEKLAEAFDVSRSAVREALSGLRAMGLVEMRQGEGTFITSFDASSFSLPAVTALIMKRNDLKELAQVRRMLEIGTVGLAAENRTESDLDSLYEALKLMPSAKGERELGEQADLAFHLAIAEATQNKMLMNLQKSVADITLESMRETRRVVLYTEDGVDRLYREHEQIYDAIKNQDADKAQAAMRHHLVLVEEVLSEYID